VRTRVVSSVFIVLIGLLATLAGGPAFALLMIGLGVAGYREFLDLAGQVSAPDLGSLVLPGSVVIVALGIAALVGAGDLALFAIAAIAIAAPLVTLLSRPTEPGGFTSWALAGSGTLLLGLPVYAAIALRGIPGSIASGWLITLVGRMALGWDSAPRGLAWALVVVLATWIGDSAAYLTGRAVGQRKLAPTLSPNKTVEGALGGLIASTAVGIVTFAAFGLGPWWIGLLIGGGIGIAGQLGDLCESFLKRQSGVKDSGALIPGHGGILDRIDALLFAFPVGLLLAAIVDRLGLS
jgi:phosphatidate cytidylyltransferase